MGVSYKDIGSSAHLVLDSARGFVDGEIYLNEKSILDVDKLKAYLCTSCLNDIMDKYFYDGEHWDLAILNFKKKSIHPLEKCCTAFQSGDFQIFSKYNDKFNTIDFTAFYCPLRNPKMEALP